MSDTNLDLKKKSFLFLLIRRLFLAGLMAAFGVMIFQFSSYNKKKWTTIYVKPNKCQENYVGSLLFFAAPTFTIYEPASIY